MKKGVATIGFLLGFLSLSSQAQLKTQCPENKPHQTYFDFSVDDIVLDILINNNSILPQFSKDEGANWTITNTMRMNLAPGDVLTIKGKNGDGPTGLVGTLHYFNKFNKEKLISTSSDWVCNGAPAVVYGLNDNKTPAWHNLSKINCEAAWIWSKDIGSGSEATCSYTIPCNI